MVMQLIVHVFDKSNQLAALYTERGRLNRARVLNSWALRVETWTLVPYHRTTLDTLNNMGVAFVEEGKLEKAKSKYWQAIDGYQKLREGHASAQRWEDYPSARRTMNNMAVVNWKQGELEKARENLRLALQDHSTVLAGDRGLILEDAFNNTGIILSALGFTDEAQVNYELALKGYEEKLGIHHRFHHRLTLSTINNLGILFAELEQWKKSMSMFDEALRGRRKTLGREHASTLDTMNNMGVCLMNLALMNESEDPSESKSQREKAKMMLEEAWRGYEKTLGSEHESTVRAERNLGCFLSNNAG